MNWPIFWAAVAALAAVSVPLVSIVGWLGKLVLEASQAKANDALMVRINGTFKRSALQDLVNEQFQSRLTHLEERENVTHASLTQLRDEFREELHKSQAEQDNRLDKLAGDMRHTIDSLARTHRTT